MKLFTLILAASILFACNATESKQTSEAVVGKESVKPSEKTLEPETPIAQPSGQVLATLENGYILRLHELIPYIPKEQKPGSIFKPLDPNFDYFVADVSLENPTAETLDVGPDMLAVYFTLSDGSKPGTGLKSASLMAQYLTDNKSKYSKKDYDLFFTSKFPANVTARSEVFAVAVPKGQAITGIGMYQKSKTKNKYAPFNP